MCLWEFTGYESYFITYDQFIGDCNSIYVVVVSMKDSSTERRRQLHFWLDYLRCRKTLVEPIGMHVVAGKKPRFLGNVFFSLKKFLGFYVQWTQNHDSGKYPMHHSLCHIVDCKLQQNSLSVLY